MLRLNGNGVEVEIAPEQGAAVARYDVELTGTWRPVLRASTDSGRAGPFALASNVLAPWSNRISGGGFRFDGRFHPLVSNTPGDHPNHGNAFSSAWEVIETSATRAVLTLSSDGPGPFRYDAQLTYALEGVALRMSLDLTNRAGIALPFGGGFHPWFPRTPQTRLSFDAAGVWTETADHLPDSYLATADHPDWDFAAAPPLPARWLNNAWTGWSGTARIEWPEHGLAATVAAAAPLRTLILYSPSADADFISIEPVSHSVDAHNRSGIGVTAPQRLKPGEALTLTATIAPELL
ncbi:MAG: aldose 1-epimerase [Devosia sp.]|uniref:aldose 1-epimerase n=1 Tax=Devosia sp. TaxID=1871048 RepID=UPI001A51648B|nr:aldose 1-epimerase [Devosia sp.]MBL8599554.1 aldose 1-epimerase [Devosia sp.]